MNRLSPLIVRRATARPLREWDYEPDEPRSDLLDDLKLFATGWLGGLVFFGTLLS